MEYIQEALKRARYEIIDDEEPYLTFAFCWTTLSPSSPTIADHSTLLLRSAPLAWRSLDPKRLLTTDRWASSIGCFTKPCPVHLA